jgi:CRP-like cAMP-binding protein
MRICCIIFTGKRAILQNILQKLHRISPLDEQRLRTLVGLMRRVEAPKNKVIIQADRVEKSIYFIEHGIARAYCDGTDHQITFWFGMEGDLIFSYNSFINGLPGYESVVLLEPCVLYEIKTADLLHLFETDLVFANWGRKMAEQELIKTEERLIARLFKSATERYQELLDSNPELIQRIQLGYIASYLGVTQVTLSRIRADVR